MSKYIFLFSFFIFSLNALDIDKLEYYIANKQYAKVCNNNIYNIAMKNQDDGILNLYAIACLRSDFINKLASVIITMRKSKEARDNAIYYSTILYKKKLLYSAIVDGVDISSIKLPKCDYILSDIYDDYVSGNYEQKGDEYYFKKDGQYKYILNTKYDLPYVKLIINILDDNLNIVEKKEYW